MTKFTDSIHLHNPDQKRKKKKRHTHRNRYATQRKTFDQKWEKGEKKRKKKKMWRWLKNATQICQWIWTRKLGSTSRKTQAESSMHASWWLKTKLNSFHQARPQVRPLVLRTEPCLWKPIQTRPPSGSWAGLLSRVESENWRSKLNSGKSNTSLVEWIRWLESSKVDSIANALGTPMLDQLAWSEQAYPHFVSTQPIARYSSIIIRR